MTPAHGDENATIHYFVDEAGDPTLFDAKGRINVGESGCSRFFMIGRLEVSDPAGLTRSLEELRREVLADPYFAGVPSLKPDVSKTAAKFHAKDDPSEVRYRVFKLLAGMGRGLRFHAVVRDKKALAAYETQLREKEPKYRYRPNELYDRLVRELFRSHHFFRADGFSILFSQRGTKDRTRSLSDAITQAVGDFEQDFGMKNTAQIHVSSSSPAGSGGLQAVDYFLWSVQRFYENEGTDKQAGESRYIQMLWGQVGEIHDLDYTAPDGRRGAFYTKDTPLASRTR